MIFKKLVSMLATVSLASSPLSLTASADIADELDRDIFKYATISGSNMSSWRRYVGGQPTDYLMPLVDAREADLVLPYTYDVANGLSFSPIVRYYELLYGNDLLYSAFSAAIFSIPTQYQFYMDKLTVVAHDIDNKINVDLTLANTQMLVVTNNRVYLTTYNSDIHGYTFTFDNQEKVDMFTMPNTDINMDSGYGHGISYTYGKNATKLYYYQENVTLARRAYNDGYELGTRVGREDGYREGYGDGQRSANVMHTFISSIFEAPINAVYTALDVEVLGANLGDVIRGIITTACVIGVIVFVVKLKIL